MAKTTAIQLQASLTAEQSKDFAWALLALITSTELSVAAKVVILSAPAIVGFFLHVLELLEKVNVESNEEFAVAKVLKERVALINQCLVALDKPQQDNAAAQEFNQIALSKILQDPVFNIETSVFDFVKNSLSVVSVSSHPESFVTKPRTDVFDASSLVGIGVTKSSKEVLSASSSSISNISKARADQTVSAENSKAYVDKPFAELSIAHDTFSVCMLFNRVFEDLFEQQDYAANRITKVINDNVGVTEQLYIGKVQENPADDSGLLAELHVKVFVKKLNGYGVLIELSFIGLHKILQETALLSETQQMLFGKGIQSKAITLADTHISLLKPLAEHFKTKESGSAYLQSYASSNYFEDSYTGTVHSI
jgi:hypothetical protein